MPRHLLALLAPLVVLSLVLSGCGDDDDDGAEETTTTTEADDRTGEDPGDGTSEPDTDPTTEPDDGGTTTVGGDGGGDADAFCAAFADIDRLLETIDDEDLGSVRQGARDAVAAVEDLAEQAPEELRDDLELLADGFERIADEADAAGSVEEFESAAEGIFDDPQYEAAGQAVGAWADENCEVDGAEDDGASGG